METDVFEITLTPAMLALVPAVALILQVLKNVEAFEKIKQYMPFIAMGIALGIQYLMKVDDPIMSSVLIGLVASGSYDATKSLTPIT